MPKPQLTYIYHNHTSKTVYAITAKSRTFADKEANGATFVNAAYGSIEAYRKAKEMQYNFYPVQLFG